METETRLLLTEEEYLQTSFEGTDCEFVDGEVVERPMPDNLHSQVQFRGGLLLHNRVQGRRVFIRTELRSRVRASRYRIPDVSAYLDRPPAGRIPSEPPYVAIEILSPEDRVSNLTQKLDEYFAWGVPNIWVVDPERQVPSVYDGQALRRVESLTLPELSEPITMRDLLTE